MFQWMAAPPTPYRLANPWCVSSSDFKMAGFDPSYATVPPPSCHLRAHFTAPSRTDGKTENATLLLVLIWSRDRDRQPIRGERPSLRMRLNLHDYENFDLASGRHPRSLGPSQGKLRCRTQS